MSNVRILSYAQVPTTPSGPAVLRTALAATLLGMFLGMAIAALREWRERSLRTSTDLTEYSGLRFLGHLPVLPAVRRPRAVGAAPAATRTPPATASGQTLPVLSRLRPPVIQVPVPVLHYPDSVYAETLRHVRLAGEATGRALPVTGVTSFHPFDGRSSVAFNLAGQLGIGMHSVLLIDADSRGARSAGCWAWTASRPDRRSQRRWQLAGHAGRHRQTPTWSCCPAGWTRAAFGRPADRPDAGPDRGRGAQWRFSRVIVDVPPLYPVAQGRAIPARAGAVRHRGRMGPHLARHGRDRPGEDSCWNRGGLGVVYDRVNLRKLKSFLLPERWRTIWPAPNPTCRLSVA